MQDPHLDKLINTGIPLPGNSGKVRALVSLSQLISQTNGLRILDIGCIGPTPLDFWRSLFTLYPGSFNLTGIDPDAAGIERAQKQFPAVTLRPGSGYDLARLFPDQPFDVIVFTQVLEHVFQVPAFFQQIAQVARPGAHLLFTFDSGHYPRRREWIKDTAKEILARLGREQHFEHPWRDDEIDPVLAKAGFEVAERGWYCLAANKKFHNRYLPDEQKNAYMRLWVEQETYINDHVTLDEAAKREFLILYIHARRK